MSAIFKTRKVQRHLIINPEVTQIRKKRRWHLPRLLLVLILLIVVTWAVFQLG